MTMQLLLCAKAASSGVVAGREEMEGKRGGDERQTTRNYKLVSSFNLTIRFSPFRPSPFPRNSLVFTHNLNPNQVTIHKLEQVLSASRASAGCLVNRLRALSSKRLLTESCLPLPSLSPVSSGHSPSLSIACCHARRLRHALFFQKLYNPLLYSTSSVPMKEKASIYIWSRTLTLNNHPTSRNGALSRGPTNVKYPRVPLQSIDSYPSCAHPPHNTTLRR